MGYRRAYSHDLRSTHYDAEQQAAADCRHYLCCRNGAALAAINKQSLWLDEAASWWFATGPLVRALHSEFTNPPLYYTLLYLWVHLFGTSEVALRGLSVIPSVASVWFTYRLAWKLFSQGVAVLSAGYMAVSTFQIYYAQEARCYALLVCFLLAAARDLWNAVTSDTRKQVAIHYALYTLAAILACCTHYIAVFFWRATASMSYSGSATRCSG